MGLFDNLMGALGAGGAGDQGEGAMGIVSKLMGQGGGGPSSSVVSSLIGGLETPQHDGDVMQGGSPPQQGGLAGMLETLAANGLGEHVSSWLSNNPNLPISEQQIHDALGSEQVQNLASQSGLPVGQFLQQLTQHLPAAASEQAGTDQG